MTDEHTNRLIHETSPYLLQHAHNPVDWYPWGEEAFEKAKAENKPVLLSIGYSACHWCHVMERESFENEKIAALMNELFVSIKVDREERPDLDEIYMNAVQMLTGRGGWPMTMFLTPEGKPFYGGTYFHRKIGKACRGFRESSKVSPKLIASDLPTSKKASDKFSRRCITWRNPARPRKILLPGLSVIVAKKLPAHTTWRTAAWDRRRNFPTPGCMNSFCAITPRVARSAI
jgi:uncharacterized protein YyaL (SSP411 family)